MSSFESKKAKFGHSLDGEWSTLYEKNIDGAKLPLEDLVEEIFMDFCGEMLNRETVASIVSVIKSGYNANKYHNFTHATHVFLNCSYWLTKLGHILNTVEKLSLLYSALIHDVEHLGVPNSTLIKKGHEFAIQYHDQSVAENRSLAVGLGLISQENYNLLKDFSEKEKVLFRANVIELVLCTDVADPYRKRLTYIKADDCTNCHGQLDTTTQSGKLALLSLVLRICDVGASSQSFNTLKIWAHGLYNEWCDAAIRGEGNIITKEFYYPDQISYMENHVLFLIKRITDTNVFDTKFTNTLRENCQQNIDEWKLHGMELLTEWENSNKKSVV